MAYLYESSEPEDISFFQNFIHNSSSPTNTKTSTTATGGFLCGVSGGGASAVVAESSYSRDFSDPMSFFPNDVKGSDEIISSGKRREFAKENLSFSREEGFEAPEMQVNRAPPCSLKRSRAPEVHNISETRRRRRINEKLKILQNLIPNSNKTDKASMLDEAIEYLKQLQLQVQMLTTRNGLSLHPSYLLGLLQSVLVPSSELGLDEGNMLLNTNRGSDTSLREQETFTQTAVGTSDHASSSQPIVTPSLTNSINTNFPSGFIPLIQNHDGLVNPLASSKDICLNDILSRLQSDTSYSWSDASVRRGFIVNK